MSDTATAERTSTVVTSETLADFHATKLGLTKPADKPGEVVAEAAEVAEEPSEGQPEGQPPKNAKLQARFSELTDKRRQAEDRAEREANRASAAEKERDELRAKLAPPPTTDDAPKPKPEDYPDAFQFAEALAEWSADNALRKRDKEEAEKAANKEREKIQQAWQGRVAKAKEAMPDYDDTIAASDVAVSDPVRDAIIESDHGPSILYLLASEPAIAEKLSKLSVLGQLREIGKLELKFEKPPEAKPKDESVEEPRRRAPAPIEPVRGGRANDNPVNTPGEFKGTFAEWKAARKAGKA